MITSVPVVCEKIANIGFDEEAHILLVEFIEAGEFLFKGVELQTFAELLYDEDKNKFVEENILDKYEVIKNP